MCVDVVIIVFIAIFVCQSISFVNKIVIMSNGSYLIHNGSLFVVERVYGCVCIKYCFYSKGCLLKYFSENNISLSRIFFYFESLYLSLIRTFLHLRDSPNLIYEYIRYSYSRNHMTLIGNFVG